MPTHRWMDLRTIEFYLAIKKNKIIPFAENGTWSFGTVHYVILHNHVRLVRQRKLI